MPKNQPHKEYNFNNQTGTYAIIEKTNKKKKISSYTKNGVLYQVGIIYYNRFEQEYKEEISIDIINEPNHYEVYLLPHLALFGDLTFIVYDYEEEEKHYPETKSKRSIIQE